MTGILLLFVAAIWFSVVIRVSNIVTKKFPQSRWRIPVAMLIVAALLPLPLIDEIVGGQQFKRVCQANSMIQVDRATAVGKTVHYVPESSVEIEGTWVRVVSQPWSYFDATTGVLVFRYHTLEAAGGRFIQTLGISEGRKPLTFHGSCGPLENTKDLVKFLGITALDRPKPNIEGN